MRRQGIRTATPYLRRWFPYSAWKLPELAKVRGSTASMNLLPDNLVPRAVDLGCGDGRNSAYLLSLGLKVVSYDMQPDYPGACPKVWMAGRDPIPESDNSNSLVLCQYLLMFLSDQEIYNLLLEIERVTRPDGYVIVELQKVKSGRDVKLSNVIDFFLKKDHLTARQREERGEWKVFHKVRNRCVLQYIHPPVPSDKHFQILRYHHGDPDRSRFGCSIDAVGASMDSAIHDQENGQAHCGA